MGIPRSIRRRVAPVGDGAPQTFDGQVGASADDAVQATSDSVSIVATNMLSDATTEHVGMRWTSVTVPAGATIDLAQVGIYITRDDLDEPQHQIRAELDANAGTFTTTSDDIDSRGRTTASENWDSANLGAVDDELWEWGSSTAGSGNGADLSAMVQEVVDLGGWASGNAMVMIFEQHTGSSTRDLMIRSWNGDPSLAARLHIEFTT